ncbi:MAG: hypothetical protein ACP5I4_03815 [Oceanipulchritudo sp.]
MEKPPPICPRLPLPVGPMTYRDLRAAKDRGAQIFHQAALRYAHFLWLENMPARAILALCRALYLEPSELPGGTAAPYGAYAWILRQYRGGGFLGNPRISFHHQATRMDSRMVLFRQRAWAMWQITNRIRPELPPEAGCVEQPPPPDRLADYLNRRGLPREGEQFQAALP